MQGKGTRIKSRTTTRRRKRKAISKMPEIEFNMKAIREIQERKKKVGKGHSKKS